MAERYGTVDNFSMEEILKISEDSYFNQIQNQQILDEDIQLAMKISIMEMGEEMVEKNEKF